MFKVESLRNLPEPGREVFYFVSIDNVYRIDVPKQTFHAAIRFNFRWRPSKKEMTNGLYESDGKGFARKQHFLRQQPVFKPANQLQMLNALADNLTWVPSEVTWRTIKEVGKECFFAQRLIAVGEFFNSFDLQAYPADTQSLTIGCKIRSSNMILSPISFGNIDFFKVSEQVFSKTYYYSNAMVEQGVVGDGEKTRGIVGYYYLYITMKVTRNPLHFVLRHCSWMLIFSFGTFGVYTISNESIGERMAYLVTIFVIFSAYSIVLSTELPEVPYYTHGDYLIICHTIFVFTVSLLIGIGSPEVLNFGESLEHWLGYVLGVFWLGYNATWFAQLHRLHKEAPNLARQPYTDGPGSSRMFAKGGVGGEVRKDGVSCFSLRGVIAPGWKKPRNHSL